MRLISLPKIKNDELLYSYLRRLSDANCLKYEELLELAREKFKIKYTDGYEVIKDLLPVFSAMGMDESDIITILEKTDLLFLLAPFKDNYSFISEMSLRIQNRQEHIELLMRPSILRRKNGIQKLKICPICVENSMYLQRQHQLPGIKICHKHHVVLWEHVGRAGTEFDIKEYRPISNSPISETDTEYADYVYELTTKIRTDATLDSIKSLLKEKVDELKEEMIIHIGSGNLIQKKRFQELFPEQGEEFIIKKYRSKLMKDDLIDIFKLLLTFYKNVDDLNIALGKYIPVRSYSEEYRQVCEQGPLYLFEHNCGNTFISSPRLLEERWGCPYCDDVLSPEQFFQKLMTVKEDFKLIGEAPVSSKDELQIRHKCGNVLTVRAAELLQDRIHCDCRRTEKASQKLRKGFEFILYTGALGKNTYFHKTCGLSFDAAFRDPSKIICPYCSKKTKIQNQVNKIEQDIPGFKVLNFVCWSKPVKLRHMACKKSFTVSNIGDFKKNPKCPICWEVPKMIPKAKDTAEKKPSRLAYTDPVLAAEWDYERNTLTPMDYTRSSLKKVWWICSRGHSWPAMISQRVYQKTGCPYCLEKIRRL